MPHAVVDAIHVLSCAHPGVAVDAFEHVLSEHARHAFGRGMEAAPEMPDDDRDVVLVVVPPLGPIRHAPLPGGGTLVIDETGHYEALAAAEHLIANGASVTYVTRFTSVAPDMENPHMIEPFHERMAGKPFSYHVNSRVLKVDGQSASIQSIHGGAETQVNADLVVFVSLNRPRDELVPALESAGIPYTYAGDVLTPQFLVAAVAQGNEAGRSV